MTRHFVIVGVLVVVTTVAVGAIQQNPPLGSAALLPDGSAVFDTYEQHRIRVTAVTRGLSHPWSMAFLPDGTILVTERVGRLRVIRKGELDPTPVPGMPQVFVGHTIFGLMDIALHPRFAENHLVYFTYTKPLGGIRSTVALARGRWTGTGLSDINDIFTAKPSPVTTPGTDPLVYAGGNAARLAFARDGKLFITIGIGDDPEAMRAQDPNDHAGKVLRLNDDGTTPNDNPFVGRPGYLPEIFTLGHRNGTGLAIHPDTGAVWEAENGPNGGDEINVLSPGRNYGWPIVSYGRRYEGPRVSEKPWQEGMEQPWIFWVPAIAEQGLMFYTGDQFPAWKGNVFVGAMRTGEVPRTGHIERIVIDKDGNERRRESLLTELHQRIRDVRQGPDGFLYALTEENQSALLRIEPAPAEATAER